MGKYRIDVIERGVRIPGRVTFHSDTERNVLDDIAQNFARSLHRRIELVAVETICVERFEVIAAFEDDVAAAGLQT